MFFATPSAAEFTMYAPIKLFGRETVHRTWATDYEVQFIVKLLLTWLKNVGCIHLFTSAKHSCLLPIGKFRKNTMKCF